MTLEEETDLIAISVDSASKIMIAFVDTLENKSIAIQDSITSKKYVFSEIDKDTDLTDKIHKAIT